MDGISVLECDRKEATSKDIGRGESHCAPPTRIRAGNIADDMFTIGNDNSPCFVACSFQSRFAQGGEMLLQHRWIFDRHSLAVHCQ